MKAARNLFLLTAGLLFVLPFAASQTATSALTPVAATAETPVPPLVPLSGTVVKHEGHVASEVSLTFLIFKDQTGGEPVFVETQSVTVDAAGHYTVQLGATMPWGLPAEVFSTGESRWLEVQQAGEQAQPRILLASVPYAMKAADAATLGGLPASAFMLAGAGTSNGGSVDSSLNGVTPAVAGTGTTDYLPLWTNSTGSLGNSVLFQSGTGSAARVGINSTSPASTLDVNGAVTARGNLSLPATGAATATGGKNSQPLSLTASAYNSGTGAAVNQNFLWQAEPTGNNTTNASATLNLLHSVGANALVETGLKVAGNGQITFAAGQKFPGTGTITGVTAGTDLTGGGTSGNVTLNLNTGALNSKYAQLAASNVFTGNNTFWTSTNIDAIDAYTPGPGKSALVGIESATTGKSYGVWAQTFDPTGAGVKGTNSGGAGGIGVYGTGDTGVYGTSNSGSGVYGISTGNGSAGVYGVDDNGIDGWGVIGQAHSNAGSGGGFFNETGDALYAEQANYLSNAAAFSGNVAIYGSLSKSSGSFKIDHPLDPANKYLYHSFVESPDMMNIYNGNVTTDAQGRAVVQLPEWFETLNRDFRYQLTVLGQFSQAIVAQKVANHQFAIQTDKPNVEVSWQVTGIRQDAWANAHRIPVEESKPEAERGFYLHPELFGAPAEKSISVARHPMLLKRLKQAASKQGGSTR